MNLSTYQSMDPHLLVGLVNTELRNNAQSLSDLCKTHDLDQEQLIERLACFSILVQIFARASLCAHVLCICIRNEQGVTSDRSHMARILSDSSL